MKPLCIDLCCGAGGWANGFLQCGYDVIGYDVENHGYPGDLILQDIRTVDGTRLQGVTVIVASPPCQEFSRHSMPWTRAKNPPPPDMSLVEACFRIAREANAPLILENVRGAIPFIGKPAGRFGACYLWGDGVPTLPPSPRGNGKERYSSTQAVLRSIVPFDLAIFLADWHGSCEREGYEEEFEKVSQTLC